VTGTTTDPRLDLLGDALEQAARRDVGRRRRRTAVRLAAAVTAVAAIGAGAAVASGVLSGETVARGMPAGSVIFGGTEPTCTLLGDGSTYDCTLAKLPTEDVLDDYTGSKQLVTIDGRIAGGCIGQDRDGRRWACFLGDDAVQRQILVRDLLGQPSFGPSRG
jgi:hypothetical protein